MKKLLLYAVLNFVTFIMTFYLAYLWFGWKMVLVLFLLNFSINVGQHVKHVNLVINIITGRYRL